MNFDVSRLKKILYISRYLREVPPDHHISRSGLNFYFQFWVSSLKEHSFLVANPIFFGLKPYLKTFSLYQLFSPSFKRVHETIEHTRHTSKIKFLILYVRSKEHHLKPLNPNFQLIWMFYRNISLYRLISTI
jgi:hypothetical protein